MARLLHTPPWPSPASTLHVLRQLPKPWALPHAQQKEQTQDANARKGCLHRADWEQLQCDRRHHVTRQRLFIQDSLTFIDIETGDSGPSLTASLQ